MDPSAPALRPEGLLALPGQAGALAVASASGVVAAGDDRGEAGVWEADGRRRAAVRFRAPVLWADVDPQGGRAAFASADGDCRVLHADGRETALRIAAGDRVLVDPAGRGVYVVSPSSGAVETVDPDGLPTGRFEAPAPVAGAVGIPRSGGLAVVSRQGMVARLSPGGALAWGGDWRRYAACVAVDPQGEVLVVCLLAHGAEVLQASSGARLGGIDVGRAVECASVGATRIALGCVDGTLVLLDRAGRPLAEVRAPARIHAVGIAGDGAVFARLADGTVRRWVPAGRPSAAPADPPARPSGRIARHPIVHARATRPPVLVAASASGERVAAAAPGRTLLLVDAEGRTVVEARHEGEMLALVVTAAGEALAATTDEIRRAGPDGDAPVRRLTLGLVAAAWSADGSVLAAADEMGSVRLLDGATGRDERRVETPPGDGAARLFADAAGIAFQTRSGAVHVVRRTADHALATRRVGTRPRLVGVGPDGPLVVSGGDRTGGDLLACGWEGEVRWTFRPSAAPSAFACLPDGRTVLVLPSQVQLLSREGRPGLAVARPEGDLAAVGAAVDATAGAGDPDVLAWTDGRRVVVSDLLGLTLADETFDAKALALAVAARGPLCAVLLDGGLALLRPAGAVAG